MLLEYLRTARAELCHQDEDESDDKLERHASNSMRDNFRLPRHLASFLGACLPILLRPAHPLYSSVSKYLNNTPGPAPRYQSIEQHSLEVPLADEMLHSVNYGYSQDEKRWMIKILRKGTAHKELLLDL